jgi:hypothetical protein
MVEPPKKQPPAVAEKTMDDDADLEPGEPSDAAAFSYTEQSIRMAFVRCMNLLTLFNKVSKLVNLVT